MSARMDETAIGRLVGYAIGCGLLDGMDRTWACNALLGYLGMDAPGEPLPDDAEESELVAVAGSEPATVAGFGSAMAPDIHSRDGLLKIIVDDAVSLGRIEDTREARERLATDLMGILTPRPRDVAWRFSELYRVSPANAVGYLHGLCEDNGYLKSRDIARNICWSGTGLAGEKLEITINLSKPEKDPRDIAAAAKASAGVDRDAATTCCGGSAAARGGAGEPYPRCALCWENEGFSGAPGHAARANLRIVPIELGHQRWGLQYSPYAYFTEHCIALSRRHVPMRVDRSSMMRLLDFIDMFPFYFIGSNADLPIVGGSILSHDHFQGGRHVFPLMEAPVRETFEMSGLYGTEGVSCGIVDWPSSVIRLESRSREELLDAAVRILDVWRGYDDPDRDILSYGGPGCPDDEPHNTLNPIAYRRGFGGAAAGGTGAGDVAAGVGGAGASAVAAAGSVGSAGAAQLDPDAPYVLDLVLRNNRTTAERPWGLFHPAEDLHHIKKENIGLIEIMGLAILPPRLAPELAAVAETLVSAAETSGAFTGAAVPSGASAQAGADSLRSALEADPLTAPHAAWATSVASRHPELDVTSVKSILRDEVTKVFSQVLEATGVYKHDDKGDEGWERLIAELQKELPALG